MAEIDYRAKITHTEKTVEQLYKMQYYVYEKPRMWLRMLIGFGLVLTAVVTGIPNWGKALLLLVGAWLLVSRDFPAAVRADRALSERKARLPNMNYSFGPEAVHLSGEGSMDIPYGKFTRLVEDRQFLYLSLSVRNTKLHLYDGKGFHQAGRSHGVCEIYGRQNRTEMERGKVFPEHEHLRPAPGIQRHAGEVSRIRQKRTLSRCAVMTKFFSV